jgi:hypothetical protein
MNTPYAISLLIILVSTIFVIRYFKSDRNPDDEIKRNNSNRMLSQYKRKR